MEVVWSWDRGRGVLGEREEMVGGSEVSGLICWGLMDWARLSVG